MHNQGLFAAHLGDLERAEQRALGADHPDVAWTLVNIAKVTAAGGNVPLAVQLSRRAIGFYRRSGTGDDPVHVARALVGQGHFEALLGEYRAARASFQKALAMRERIYRFALPTANNVFPPGRRLMVQAQSSWFPLYDRNPETFVHNIFWAKPDDYRKAVQCVTFVELPVVTP